VGASGGDIPLAFCQQKKLQMAWWWWNLLQVGASVGGISSAFCQQIKLQIWKTSIYNSSEI